MRSAGAAACRASAAIFLAINVVCGCSFAPPYHVPNSAATPPEYKETDAAWKTAHPGDQLPRGDWWAIFNDAQLHDLENQARDANQNLKAAFARLQQARADTRIARADLFPSVSATASATRARASSNSPTFVKGSPTEGNDFVLQGDVSYELDLWGRVRNAVAAARATQQGSAADLASLGLSIQAEVATDYFGLRSFDTQQHLLAKTIEDYAKSLTLTQDLFNGGAVPISDVAQAKTQLRSAQTQSADIHLMRAQLEHAIAVLVGQNPSEFKLPPNPLPENASPPAVDAGIPSVLLERRPDVAEAERRVAAANAQIGVARAAYFPQFTIAGTAGYDSVHSSGWISAPSLFWSIGPQVTLPIFEGGRLVAQTAHAKAAYEEQVATYRNTVLSAYQEVEDNLAALRDLETESETESEAVDASYVALQKSQDRYAEGIVTFLEVSTTETAALQAQLSSINIRTRRLNAAVQLIKALGGGWQRTDLAAETVFSPATNR
jgi:NodT family efflux transporter outer membrane factor (OMF) lipoprotein